ncbi:MAG: ABC transporter substrate-binding protein [Betaproteobacteria bacterium]|nr:ABC transporter substrate-binding protein [Betaproteobacteria bacterium]
MNIHLAENFRAVFYAPFYACLELGWFRDRGLEVNLIASPSPGAGITDMLRGDIHLVWGGPMRVLKDRDLNAAGPQSLVAFGEVAARDPFYLVGRPGLAPFDLRALPSLRLATVSEVVTPWLCLQQDLRDLGIDPNSIQRRPDAPMEDNLRALGSGQIDVAQLFEPYVSLALRDGIGHPLHAAHARGPTAYTTFLSTVENIERYGEAFRAMAEALSGFGPWIDAQGARELSRLVGHLYPQLAPDLLEQCLARCHQTAIWSCQPQVSRAGFHRLAKSLASANFISQVAPYEDSVAPWAQAPL